MELRAIRQLRGNGSALAVAMPGAQGRAMRKKAADTKREALLVRRMAPMMRELGAPLRGFPEDSAELKDIFVVFYDSEIRRLQVLASPAQAMCSMLER